MTSRAYRAAVTCAAVVVAAGFPGQAQAQNFTPVTDAVLQNPDPADWLSWRRTLDGWGYSPLESDRPQQRRAAPTRLVLGTRAGGCRRTTPIVH